MRGESQHLGSVGVNVAFQAVLVSSTMYASKNRAAPGKAVSTGQHSMVTVRVLDSVALPRSWTSDCKRYLPDLI